MQNRSLITCFAAMDVKPNESMFSLFISSSSMQEGEGRKGGRGGSGTRAITYPEAFLELKVR